jgi:hypothetical protein
MSPITGTAPCFQRLAASGSRLDWHRVIDAKLPASEVQPRYWHERRDLHPDTRSQGHHRKNHRDGFANAGENMLIEEAAQSIAAGKASADSRAE